MRVAALAPAPQTAVDRERPASAPPRASDGPVRLVARSRRCRARGRTVAVAVPARHRTVKGQIAHTITSGAMARWLRDAGARK